MAFDEVVSYKIYHPGVDKLLTQQEYDKYMEQSRLNYEKDLDAFYKEYEAKKEKEYQEALYRETPEYKAKAAKEQATREQELNVKRRASPAKAHEARAIRAKERQEFRDEMKAEKMKQLKGDPEALEKYNKMVENARKANEASQLASKKKESTYAKDIRVEDKPTDGQAAAGSSSQEGGGRDNSDVAEAVTGSVEEAS